MKLYGKKYTAKQLIGLLAYCGSMTNVSKNIDKPISTVWDWYRDIEILNNIEDTPMEIEDVEEVGGGLSGKRVLCIGDTHFPATTEGYVKFCKDIYDKHEADYVVHIGDMADQYYMNFHEKDIHLIECDREYEATKEMMQNLFKTFPTGTWIIGNHDSLVERQRKNLFLPKFAIKKLRDMYDVPDTWRIQNKIIIDDVLYIHRFKGGGSNPHIVAAKKLGMSVVLGHHHFSSGVSYHANHYKMFFGMCTGCGVDRESQLFKDRMEYSEDCISREIISCGVVYNRKQAYIEPMIL